MRDPASRRGAARPPGPGGHRGVPCPDAGTAGPPGRCPRPTGPPLPADTRARRGIRYAEPPGNGRSPIPRAAGETGRRPAHGGTAGPAPPRSLAAVSHAGSTGADPAAVGQLPAVYSRSPASGRFRTEEEIRGLDPVEPGAVPVQRWRPDGTGRPAGIPGSGGCRANRRDGRTAGRSLI
ncbi:hypothetical protein DPM19_11825 [Actinomadura craniellae]|uniref:Uncharacterized protein n=1 Tax=Actinomadura craniellae TaxID=2231787 RepID=A0A365H8C9_9ACTN|nr:hypothetical protein DPM19_11825 [Actinomadura craniellae]